MKRARTTALLALALLAACTGLSCSRLSVETPDGFACLQTRGDYRAVSPEGMQLRVRTLANDPEKSLEFWSEALAKHLEKEGYRPAGPSRPFAAPDATGVVHEWAVPYGHESYLYMTALAVRGGQIILAEAAAPYAVFVLHRDALTRSLESVRVGR